MKALGLRLWVLIIPNIEPLCRTHLKNVFWPNIFVGASFQILDNQQVACGLKLGPAAILNQNPIFEMGSRLNNSTVTHPLLATQHMLLSH